MILAIVLSFAFLQGVLGQTSYTYNGITATTYTAPTVQYIQAQAVCKQKGQNLCDYYDLLNRGVLSQGSAQLQGGPLWLRNAVDSTTTFGLQIWNTDVNPSGPDGLRVVITANAASQSFSSASLTAASGFMCCEITSTTRLTDMFRYNRTIQEVADNKLRVHPKLKAKLRTQMKEKVIANDLAATTENVPVTSEKVASTTEKLATTVELAAQQTTCPDTWSNINDVCFNTFVTQAVGLFNAQAVCLNYGATMCQQSVAFKVGQIFWEKVWLVNPTGAWIGGLDTGLGYLIDDAQSSAGFNLNVGRAANYQLISVSNTQTPGAVVCCMDTTS